jgi:argininosuccinate lyase
VSTLLWQKAGVEVDPALQAFLAGEDVVADRALFLHDLAASRAHAEGLRNIGILSEAELLALSAGLSELEASFRAGTFVLDDRYEDGHSAIEAVLTERLGDAGRRIHTGRSRNDQVLVASRLWLKERLQELRAACLAIAGVALDRAAEPPVPMPGYTHLQRAVPSSTAVWWAGVAEAFVDDAVRAADTLRWVDANPLGTAAGFGVNLPLDRAHTTAALGFGRMQVSPPYAQTSRGKFELAALEAVSSATLDLRRVAWDLSLWTTAEFGFVTLPPKFTTGSSIMPNKRNPDVVELLRAVHGVVAGARVEIEQLLALPTGYHRDLQGTKAPLLRGFGRPLQGLWLVPTLLQGLGWRAEVMRAAIDPGTFATDVAVEAAVAGVPFREAYRAAAEGTHGGRTPEGSLAARVSPGGAADLRLAELRARWVAAG